MLYAPYISLLRYQTFLHMRCRVIGLLAAEVVEGVFPLSRLMQSSPADFLAANAQE